MCTACDRGVWKATWAAPVVLVVGSWRPEAGGEEEQLFATYTFAFCTILAI